MLPEKGSLNKEKKKCVVLASNESEASCENMDCHKGTCQLIEAKPVCVCDPQYTGEFCNTYLCSGPPGLRSLLTSSAMSS